jgi:PAS domain S-box-containing protein
MFLSGTLVVGPLGIVEAADRQACELLGYARAELVGMHGSELVPPSDRPLTAVTLDRMRLGQVTSRQAFVKCKSGTLVQVEVIAQMLPNSRLSLTLRCG